MAVATLSSALIALAIGLALAGAEAKSLHPDFQLMRGEVQQYGDWLVGCSNTAECIMLGFPGLKPDGRREADVTGMGLRISLSGTIDPALTVEIFPFGTKPTATGPAKPFHLGGPGESEASARQFGYARSVLLEDEAGAVLAALGKGEALFGYAPQTGQAIVRFPGDQFARAYRAMQARREALVQELAAKAAEDLPGELPDGSAMPGPDPLRRRIAVPVMISGFAPILAARKCGASPMRDMRRYRFSGGAELWSYVCGDAGQVQLTFWEMAPDAAAKTAPLDLPETRGRPVRAGTDGLANAQFDFDFGVLRNYRFQPGRTDCGTFRAWGFTQNGWHLLQRKEMPLCMGLEPGDWIETHFQPTSGSGPDE